MADVRIDDHSDEYLNDVASSLDKALEAVGIHLSGEAQEELDNSPRRIDTGLLRNSITYAMDGEAPEKTSYSADNESQYGKKGKPSGSYSGSAPKEGKNARSVMIGTNVEYAIYVHEGTRDMSPNRFLKNALERNQDQITQYIKDAMS
jgi:HK97 gp10 family phage protein